MNVSKGDLAIIIGAERNNGLLLTVIEFHGMATDKSKTFYDYWVVESSKSVKDSLNRITNKGLVRDKNMRRISPPQDQLIPDPIEVPINQPEMA